MRHKKYKTIIKPKPDVLSFEKINIQTGAYYVKDDLDKLMGINGLTEAEINGISDEETEEISKLTKSKIDGLSYEELVDISSSIMFGIDYQCSKTALFAKTIINGCPYIDIMEPYLREAAGNAGYIYKKCGFIYTFADEIYKELTENKKGKKDVRLIDLTYALDGCQPLCVIVKKTKTEIIWSAYCHYNITWHYGELPVFRFEKAQYAAALDQLKAIVDEQTKLPTAESLGKAVYTGDLKDGKRSGFGTLTWADGSKHEGTWEKGKRNGLFVHTDEKGVTRREIWINDLLTELPGN